jgi:hypothetical protein
MQQLMALGRNVDINLHVDSFGKGNLDMISVIDITFLVLSFWRMD